eukprot:jgi/Undpi1/1302/HiC_scaffold_11.g04694.m1
MKRVAATIKGPKGGSWDMFIGLEVHAQVKLQSKLFSRSQAAAPSEHDQPNSRVSLFDASFPGTLPVLNASAVDQAVRTALALGSDVHRRSVFERKHYFYSDLPHGYQITQQRHPIASGGSLPLIFESSTNANTSTNTKINTNTCTNTDTNSTNAKTTNTNTNTNTTPNPSPATTSTTTTTTPANIVEAPHDAPIPLPPSVGITRIQLEVDSGKSLHDSTGNSTDTKHGRRYQNSLVDLNRAGTALMEIVFEPEIRSAAEAGATLRSLQLLLRKLRSCDGNMEDGSIRCDLNVSVRPRGTEGMGERVEVKNMNSVRHLMTAAAFEALRQVRQLELGEGPVERETRGFDVGKGETTRLRRKEGQVDYRFFPEPDLPPLVIEDARVDAIKATLPELPEMTLARLSREHGIPEHLSRLIVCAAAGGASDYFERIVNGGGGGVGVRRDPKVAANWVSNNLFGLLKDQLGRSHRQGDNEDEIERLFPADRLGGLLDLLDNGTISSQTAKALLREMVQEDLSSSAMEIVEAKGLRQMTDKGKIETLCRGIVEDPKHEKQLASYRKGKKNLSKFFMGQAFKATKGRADGKVVGESIMRLLDRPEGDDGIDGPPPPPPPPSS